MATAKKESVTTLTLTGSEIDDLVSIIIKALDSETLDLSEEESTLADVLQALLQETS